MRITKDFNGHICAWIRAIDKILWTMGFRPKEDCPGGPHAYEPCGVFVNLAVR